MLASTADEQTEPEDEDIKEVEGDEGDDGDETPLSDQQLIEVLRYELQVVFKGTAPRAGNVTSVNRSKSMHVVKGIEHHLAIDDCLAWWSNEPQSKQWPVNTKEVVVMYAVGKTRPTAYRSSCRL